MCSLCILSLCRQWGEENEDGRLPNGILGVLIREAFPGIIKYKERDEPAWHWQQYDFAEDTSDEGTVRFDSAKQVEECFWVSLIPSVYYHISC